MPSHLMPRIFEGGNILARHLEQEPISATTPHHELMTFAQCN